VAAGIFPISDINRWDQDETIHADKAVSGLVPLRVSYKKYSRKYNWFRQLITLQYQLKMPGRNAKELNPCD